MYRSSAFFSSDDIPTLLFDRPAAIQRMISHARRTSAGGDANRRSVSSSSSSTVKTRFPCACETAISSPPLPSTIT